MPVPEPDRQTDEVREVEALVDGGESLRRLVTSVEFLSHWISLLAMTVATMYGVVWTQRAIDSGETVTIVVMASLTAIFGLLLAAVLDRTACLMTDGWNCQDCRDETDRWAAEHYVGDPYTEEP